MFQIRRIGFRIISLYLVSHDLHFPARTGGNRRDNRIQFIHLMQFVASHPYTTLFLPPASTYLAGNRKKKLLPYS